MTPQKTLVSYAMSFASFLLDSNLGGKIRKIILFGSVARGDFTDESDIDLFIDCEEKHEKEIQKTLTLFHASQMYKTWQIKGIKETLSLKIGNLQHWKLKREVISSGILLFGKYHELPEKIEYYLMITLESLQHKSFAQQMKIWRALYGYKQKVGKKVYETKGLIDTLQGKKLGKAVFLIPMGQRKAMLSFLNKNKISYFVHEVWSDTI